MILALRDPSRPPTGAEEIRDFFSKVAPGNIFGLAVQSVRLARGTVAPELRRELTIAVAIGWAMVALVAAACLISSTHEALSAYTLTFVLFFSLWVMVAGGSLVYNRATHGFYL